MPSINEITTNTLSNALWRYNIIIVVSITTVVVSTRNSYSLNRRRRPSPVKLNDTIIFRTRGSMSGGRCITWENYFVNTCSTCSTMYFWGLKARKMYTLKLTFRLYFYK